MKKNNKEKGNLGENIAIDFLLKNGFTIIEKNYQKRYGEIDIIGKKDNFIIFFEVKLRKNINNGYPIESITENKISKIKNVAETYLYENGLFEQDIRFDVISILLENGYYNITHIENAF